jgi:hypothetical protein
MTGESSLPISQNKLPPCECFTILEWRKGATWPQCDVCDRPEAEHENPGRRTLSGGEIEAIRRRMIIAIFDEREEERPPSADNGREPA